LALVMTPLATGRAMAADPLGQTARPCAMTWPATGPGVIDFAEMDLEQLMRVQVIRMPGRLGHAAIRPMSIRVIALDHPRTAGALATLAQDAFAIVPARLFATAGSRFNGLGLGLVPDHLRVPTWWTRAERATIRSAMLRPVRAARRMVADLMDHVRPVGFGAQFSHAADRANRVTCGQMTYRF
jgi:hypothetical protein